MPHDDTQLANVDTPMPSEAGAGKKQRSDRALLIEQLRLIHRQIPAILVGNLAASAILSAVIYSDVVDSSLFTWVGCVLLLTLARIVYYRHIRQTGVNEQSVSRVKAGLLGFSLLSGCLWGAAGVIFFNPDQPLMLVILFLILAGMAAGAVASTSAYPPIYYVYALPTMLPTAVMNFFGGDEILFASGFAMLFFLGINLVYCRHIHQTIIKGLNLRFENVDLISALTEQKDIAEKASIAKSRFLAAASHDLRQPLHAQGLFLDGLKPHIRSKAGREVYKKVLGAKQSLDQLFNALLDISRLDAGVVEPKLEVFDVKPMLEALHQEYVHIAARKHLHLLVDARTTRVKSDRLLLERSVRNLISNAIRYTEAGEVSIRARADNGQVRIKVSDSGVGIPQSELENIFSEYHQLNNPERDRNKGLGLGLAIVARLSELLEVDVSVQSEEGRGTTFSLALNESREALTPQRSTRAVSANPAQLSVLVIDDERDILDGMQTLLASWHYRCIAAESADEAVNMLLADGHCPDVIVADYRLRDNQTGLAAIERVCDEFNVDIPGIIITGDIEARRLVEAQQSGYQLLHKPVSPDELRNVISNVLVHSKPASNEE